MAAVKQLVIVAGAGLSPVPAARSEQDGVGCLRVINQVLTLPVQRVMFVRIFGSQPETRPAWMTPELFDGVCKAEYTAKAQFDALAGSIVTSLEVEVTKIKEAIKERKKKQPKTVESIERFAAGFAERVAGRRMLPEIVMSAIRAIFFCSLGLQEMQDRDQIASRFCEVRDLILNDRLVPLGAPLDSSTYLVYIV